MKIITLLKVNVLSLLSLVFANANGQTDSVIRVNPTVYVITGLGGNITAKITNSGVVLVDAGTSYDAGIRLKKIIAGITDKPVTHVILTHYHSDHSYGLAAFFPGVTIIGQAGVKGALLNEEKNLQTEILNNIPEKIKKAKDELASTPATNFARKTVLDSTIKAETARLQEQKKIKIIYPDKYYDKDYTLVSGSDTILITYSGNAHTNSDSWVFLKNDNIIVLGDMLFTNSYPYIDDRTGADTKNWASVLKVLARRNCPVYISGHGKIAKAGDLARFSNYLSDLRGAVNQAIKEGKSVDDSKKAIQLEAYKDFDFAFFKEQNIEAVYNELSKK